MILKPILAVAVDVSESIAQRELTNTVQSVYNELLQDEDLQTKFNIEPFSFGATLQRGFDPTFEALQTNISEPLKTISQTYKGQPTAIVLISDGNQTYGESYVHSTVKYKKNVFPIIVGDTIRTEDLSISRVNSNKYAFLSNEFPIELFLNYTGVNPVDTKLTILENGTSVFSQPLHFSAKDRTKVVETSLMANKVGTRVFKAVLEALPEEYNLQNNRKDFAIEVVDEKTKILLVSAITHPDVGMLKRSIEKNQQRLVTIVSPETVGDKIAENQLLILYQPNRSFSGVWEQLIALKKNTFIIAGTQTDWNFLNSQQSFIQKQVTSQTEDFQALWNPTFNSFILEDIGFEDFSPLTGMFGTITMSAAVQPFLVQKIRNTTTTDPLLAVAESDGQRHVFLLGENSWKWRMQSFATHNGFEKFDEFIGKLIFYASSNKRSERLVVQYEPFYESTGSAVINAQYFDKNYISNTNALLTISLTHKRDSTTTTIPMLQRHGNYEVGISHLPAGEYSFQVSVARENISKKGEFTILDYNAEIQHSYSNAKEMIQLAHLTGGKAYMSSEVANLKENLLNSSDYKSIQKEKETVSSLIDWRLLLVLLVLLLSAEWFIRKYNGLI